MISINLLPDSKMQKIKAKRRGRSIAAGAVIAIGAGVALPAILVMVWLGQKGVLKLKQNDIDKKQQTLKSDDILPTILTVQNQLSSLDILYQNRLYYSNIYKVLPAAIPANSVGVRSIDIDSSGAMTISGTADNISAVNNFVNILAATKLVSYDSNNNRVEVDAFTGLSPEFTPPQQDEKGKITSGSTFTIDLTFDLKLLEKDLPYDVFIGSKQIYTYLNPDEQSQNNDDQPNSDNGSALSNDSTDGGTQ